MNIIYESPIANRGMAYAKVEKPAWMHAQHVEIVL